MSGLARRRENEQSRVRAHVDQERREMRRKATMPDRPADNEQIEYAVKIDCAANGCDPPHNDDGRFMSRATSKAVPKKINGHVVTAYKRTVTYGEWKKV